MGKQQDKLNACLLVALVNVSNLKWLCAAVLGNYLRRRMLEIAAWSGGWLTYPRRVVLWSML